MDLQYHRLLLMVVYDWNKSNLTIMYCYSSLNADIVFDTIVCRYTLHRRLHFVPRSPSLPL